MTVLRVASSAKLAPGGTTGAFFWR
jgi:hypothetical protein